MTAWDVSPRLSGGRSRVPWGRNINIIDFIDLSTKL